MMNSMVGRILIGMGALTGNEPIMVRTYDQIWMPNNQRRPKKSGATFLFHQQRIDAAIEKRERRIARNKSLCDEVKP